MKKIIIIFLFVSCGSIVNQKKISKSQNIYLTNIKIIERYLNEETIEQGLSPSILFLEELTKLKSRYSVEYIVIYTPTNKNLRQWKKWYKKNKKRLYFDEKEQKVKVSNNI